MIGISKRLRASVRMDAINGDSFERSICAKQMTEAANAIDSLERERDALRSQLIDIVRVLGRDIPDCIDNDGQPYQSQSFSEWIDSQEVQPNER